MPDSAHSAVPRCKKSLGQHFLNNSSLCARMVEELELTSSDMVMEIGPGAGALTTHLERAPHDFLLLIEKDYYWARVRGSEGKTSTQCVLTDAMDFDFSRLGTDGSPWTVCGNLPYNVASPIIWNVAAYARLRQALFMVQLEVGRRLCAKPGSGEYGALSVWVQNFLTPRLICTVPPSFFSPRPKVDSAVVHFAPAASRLARDLFRPLKKVLELCFQKRRKQLGGILRRAHLPEADTALSALGLNGSQRPEELSPSQFRQLAAFFAHVLT